MQFRVFRKSSEKAERKGEGRLTYKSCRNGHDEISYQTKNCPVCTREIEIFGLRGNIAELKGGIETLKEKLKNLMENRE